LGSRKENNLPGRLSGFEGFVSFRGFSQRIAMINVNLQLMLGNPVKNVSGSPRQLLTVGRIMKKSGSCYVQGTSCIEVI